jgi:hypothetical protein
MIRAAVLLASLVLLLPACATRGTIGDLGHPEFDPDLPKKPRLTLVEPPAPGQFDAYEAGAKEDGDHRALTQMEEAPHLEGTNVVFSIDASARGPIKVTLIQVLAYPLTGKDLIPWKIDGKLPEGGHPAAAFFNDGHYTPGGQTLHLDIEIPQEKLGGADQMALPTFLLFEDGWVTIVYNVVSLPKP